MIHVHVDYSGSGGNKNKEWDSRISAWGAAFFLGNETLQALLTGGILSSAQLSRQPNAEQAALQAAIAVISTIEFLKTQPVTLYTDEVFTANQSLHLLYPVQYVNRENPRHQYAHEAANLYRRSLCLETKPPLEKHTQSASTLKWTFSNGKKNKLVIIQTNRSDIILNIKRKDLREKIRFLLKQRQMNPKDHTAAIETIMRASIELLAE